MRTQETPTSTGGLLVEYFDDQGQRIRAVHVSGKNYSGRLAQIESKEQTQRRKTARAAVV